MLTRFSLPCARLDLKITASSEPSDVLLKTLVVDVEEDLERRRAGRKGGRKS